MQNLNQLNQQFAAAAKPQRGQPTSLVWESLGLDRHLRSEVIEKRLRVQQFMEDIYDQLPAYIERQETPKFIIPMVQRLGINGMSIKDHGGPGFSNLEGGAVIYEMAKRDASIATFVLVHNAIGTNVISCLGDEEQRARLLKESLNMDQVCCFGLTEPNNGSDASSLKTTATKVEGGYLINGEKRWIGNATFAGQICVWARNPEEGNNVQCFVVTKGSPGLTTSKIMNKYSLRMVENADIKMKDVFVPNKNKLTHAKNFATGTNVILESSRLGVAWMIVGVACGAYEAALKYALQRKQFGKPIAKFQLNQEKLSRMLGYCEMMLNHVIEISNMMDMGTSTMGQVARAKALCSRLTREVVALAREVCGGNGIILDNHVMKSFIDIEGMYTYEGTYDINMLVSGRELTGGLAAFK